MSTEVLDYQEQIDQQLDILLNASSTNPSESGKTVYEVLVNADRIFTTPDVEPRILAQAAYVLWQGARITRQYMGDTSQASKHRDTALKQREQEYRDYINQYDQKQKDMHSQTSASNVEMARR